MSDSRHARGATTRPVPVSPRTPGPAPTPPDIARLVALHHQLHSLTVQLLINPPPAAEVTRLVTGLLDTARPLTRTLDLVAPRVVDTLARLDKTTHLTILCGELTEAHRLLGHGLRDHHIDPGPPPAPVEDLLHAALTGPTHRVTV